MFRDLYRGRIVWGRTRWVDRGGTKVKQDVPESEWLVLERPGLRILSEDLWQAAHDRLGQRRTTYLRSSGGRLWGRPEAGIESRYLLSGFAQCGACADAMHAIKRSSRRGEARVYYVCNAHRVRGDTVCTNSLSAPMDTLDAEVLGTIRRDVLAPDVLQAVITRALDLRARPGDLAERRERLHAELRRVETELARFAEAVGAGEPLRSLLDAMKARERRRAELQAQLEHLDGLGRSARNPADMMHELSQRLTDWHGVLERHPVQARQLLRKLLDGRLILTPRIDETGRWYEVTGRAVYGRLLSGIVSVVGVVPPG